MNKRYRLWLVMVLAAGSCNPYGPAPGIDAGTPGSGTVENNGVQYTLETIRECHYPANDPLYEKRWNKKLLVLQMKVHCTGLSNKNLLTPRGAVLTDRRANNYETSPVVIAIAQNSRCINGNDIKDYNAIWNGDVKSGETYTAFVLGFELPEDAVPDKLYWNNDWKNQRLFFLFTDTGYSVSR